MSRWEALKPDNHGSHKRTSKTWQREPYHSIRTSSKIDPRNNNDTPKNRFSRRTMNRDNNYRRQSSEGDCNWELSLENLKACLQDNSHEMDAFLVEQSLKEISIVSQSCNVSSENLGTAVMTVVDSLPISRKCADRTASLCRFITDLLRTSKITLTAKASNKCTSILSKEYQDCNIARTKTAFSVCLAKIVSTSVKDLPAERTAHTVVASVFLDMLEATDQDSMAVVDVLQALHALLIDSRHASAILAPLVQDVGVDGNELKVTNPIRQKLFNALQRHLFNEDFGARQESCNCISKAMLVTHKLEQSFKRWDVDMGAMERFLAEVVSSVGPDKREYDQLLLPALELILAIVRRSPEAGAGLASRLLLRSTTELRFEHERCTICSLPSNEFVHLLEIIHMPRLGSDENGKIDTTTIQCVADLLEAMPLQKWFGAAKSKTKQMVQTSFCRNITISLNAIIQTCRCRFLRSNMKSTASLLRLAKVIFLLNIYTDDSLAKASTELWSTLADLLFDLRHSQTLKDSIAMALVETMGGRVNPQGELTKMCVPAGIYLSSSAGVNFLDKLFASVEACDRNWRNSKSLIRAILRTRPRTALLRWDVLKRIIRTHTSNQKPDIRSAALEILEGLIGGRRDFDDANKDSPADNSISIFTGSLLKEMVSDSNAKVRSLVFQSYGGLQGRDWMAILKEESTIICHAQLILMHCQNPADCATGEANANVRSEACKAIGELSSHCLSLEVLSCFSELTVVIPEDDVRAICKAVFETMLKSLHDSNASVRCMVSTPTPTSCLFTSHLRSFAFSKALFALGNLALALRNRFDCFDFSTLVRVCTAVHQCMQDSDDKVRIDASGGHCDPECTDRLV